MASLPATVHAANKEGRAKLVQEIHTHAKAHGKSMRTAAKIEGVGFSGSRTALMACSSSECSCVVTLRCRKEGWRVDLCSCRPHNRLCVSTARTNKARDIAAVSSVQLAVSLEPKLKTKAVNVMGAIEGGAHASKTTAWRAKQEVITMSETEYNYSYQIIKPFLDKLVQTNPGSHTVFLTDKENKLVACGYLLGSAAEVAARAGLDVIALDACHLHGSFQGRLLILEAKLPTKTMCNLPVAYLIALDEKECTHALLLELALKNATFAAFVKQCTVVSDRGKGLIPAVAKALPDACHVWCLIHMLRNLKHNCGAIHEGTYWSVVKAATYQELETNLECLRAQNAAAADYLEEQEGLFFLADLVEKGVSMFGKTTSNQVEQENGRLDALGVRAEDSPLDILSGILDVQMSVITRLVGELKKVNADDVILPSIRDKYDEESMRAPGMMVEATPLEFVYQVKEVRTKRRIDLAQPFLRHGNCVTCQQERRPCAHYIAAAMECHKTTGFYAPGVTTVTEFFTHCHHQAYLVDTLRQALNGRTVELVEMEELRSDKCTLPSFPYDDKKKKKKKRIASAGENVPSAGAGAGSGEARRGDDGEPATPLRRSIRRKL